MYNYFKFKDQLQRTADHLEQQNRLKVWSTKHRDDKQLSHEKYVSKVKEFVDTVKQQPYYCEDDHFQSWRNNHLFRDAAEQTRFKGYKAFVYRNNKDMNSLSDLRQRTERHMAQQKSEILIDKQLITPEMKLRSLQSQGPYTPVASFRGDYTKSLQPPLRFRSVTDQERFIQHHLPENKFNHVVFKTMDDKKHRIGVTTKSPIPTPKISNGRISEFERSITTKNRSDSKVEKTSQTVQVKLERPRIISTVDPTMHDQYSLYVRTPDKVNSVIEMVNRDHLRPLKKYHFKGAKQLSQGITLSLKDQQQSVSKTTKVVLKDCQIDREKHLENIKNNVNFEVFHKVPIL